jgi:hypothetical protein
VKDLLSPNALVLTEAFFQRSAISLERVRNFFEDFAIAEADLADKIRGSANRPGDDFTRCR